MKSLKGAIGVAYKLGEADTEAFAKDHKKKLWKRLPRSGKHSVYKDAALTYQERLDVSKKNVRLFFRRTKQTLLDDRMLLSGFDGLSRPQIAERIAERLKVRLGDGNFVEVGGRQYKLSTYAEMLSRTTTSEAHTAGVLETMKDHRITLAKVSDHGTTTPICKEYEGEIYTTGESGEYEKLDMTPPFHPNCLHLLEPYIEDEE